MFYVLFFLLAWNIVISYFLYIKKEKCHKKGEFPKFSKMPYVIDAFLSGKDEHVKRDTFYDIQGVRWVQYGDDINYGFLLCPKCGKKGDIYDRR